MIVLETGLGGETDATNIVKNTICAAFATISVDHLGVIGDTLEEIARTKSGIIKPGCAVVSARQTDVVRNVLKKKSRREELLLCRGGARENENSNGQLRWNHIFL